MKLTGAALRSKYAKLAKNKAAYLKLKKEAAEFVRWRDRIDRFSAPENAAVTRDLEMAEDDSGCPLVPE
eukprot:316346-Rhodomonas_salina.1